MNYILVLMLFFAFCSFPSAEDFSIYPQIQKTEECTDIRIVGIPIKTTCPELMEIFDRNGIQPCQERPNFLEYAKLPSGNDKVKGVQINFFKNNIYHLTLIFEDNKQKSWNKYEQLRGLMGNRYGAAREIDDGTFASSEWNNLAGGKIDLKLTWEEDPGITYIDYYYMPVYNELIKLLKGDK
jgi:hypothetical protein